MKVTRRDLLLLSVLFLAAGAILVAGHEKSSNGTPMTASASPPGSHGRVIRTYEEWKKILTPAQFHVTREKGTETPFSGPNWDNHAPGTYRCVCCDLPLFDSRAKFDSGTGWPSFRQPISRDAVLEAGPRSPVLVPSGGSVRRVQGAEVLCARCDAHLGDVFDDGPKPTGLRYCMNGTALMFIRARE